MKSRLNKSALLLLLSSLGVSGLYGMGKEPPKSVLPPVDNQNPWEGRTKKEQRWRDEGLTLLPFEANYFFPFTYNTTPHSTTDDDAEHVEVKFQLSLKVLFVNNFLNTGGQFYFAYTQMAFWQLYNTSRSSPFRDVNYQPEILYAFDTAQRFGAWTLRHVDYGLAHQSNGVQDPDSRSWNRLYAKFSFDRKNIALSVKPWYRIPESQAEDNNPDIYDYMGYGEVVLTFALQHHMLSFLVRNNLDVDDNHGALQVDYNFPLTRSLTGLIQYFTGYGESLIDYNRANNRFSIGLALSEWY